MHSLNLVINTRRVINQCWNLQPLSTKDNSKKANIERSICSRLKKGGDIMKIA